MGRCAAYEEAMDVGEEDGQLAARPQQLRILYGGHEVAAVWPTGCGAGGEINSQRLERQVVGSASVEMDDRMCAGAPGTRVLLATNGARHSRPRARDQHTHVPQ
jgi:predicted molibdopterin-dependent oxidoreductase YjgC